MNQIHTFHAQYLQFNAAERTARYQTSADAYWQQTGEQLALDLFRSMSVRVSAYQHFLARHHIQVEKINSYADLQFVPPTDKPTYIDQYPLSDLCWDGKIQNSSMLSASSGSTGLPNFWPRSDEQTMQGAIISELIYREFFQMSELSTLYIISFGMGMWIAGTYMMNSTQWVAQKGVPLTVAAPGINKSEILRLIELGTNAYQQIVLIGLPPFIKDVIDTGIAQGINWQSINIRFMFSGEAFTERWRSHMHEKVGFNLYTDTINLYGSADIGLNAHETPTTVYLRRLAADSPDIAQGLFDAVRIPSVNQYDPHLRHFEAVDGELLVSARSGIPLLRYNTKDMGNVLYFSEVEAILHKNGIDLLNHFALTVGNANLLWRLPLVYLFGRGKFSATLYGITLFPEYIKYVLDSPSLGPYLTGKFTIVTNEREDYTQELQLRVERNEFVETSEHLAALVKQTFIEELPKISSEYQHLLGSIGVKAHPQVSVHYYGDPEYFPRGIVKKTA